MDQDTRSGLAIQVPSRLSACAEAAIRRAPLSKVLPTSERTMGGIKVIVLQTVGNYWELSASFSFYIASRVNKSCFVGGTKSLKRAISLTEKFSE